MDRIQKKDHIKQSNPGLERQIPYVLPHMKFLALNPQIWNVIYINWNKCKNKEFKKRLVLGRYDLGINREINSWNQVN